MKLAVLLPAAVAVGLAISPPPPADGPDGTVDPTVGSDGPQFLRWLEEHGVEVGP